LLLLRFFAQSWSYKKTKKKDVFCLNLLQMGPKAIVRVHDTRGVLCVHGLPGFLAAIAGIIATAIAAQAPLVFGTPFPTLFPRSFAAGYQAAALVKKNKRFVFCCSENSSSSCRPSRCCLLVLEVC
jgi:hypothetical protein